ncbi:hypothetical protein SLE2022_226090 [Rubroshorea leprosula]
MEAELRHVSSSRESLLSCCRFFRKPEASAAASSSSDDDDDDEYQNPAYIPVDSTRITMVSPPESPDDENSYLEDLFHTPPEGSPSVEHGVDHRTVEGVCDRDGDTVPVDADYAGDVTAVKLGRDTDLGFSEVEVELTQRVEIDSGLNVAIQSEPDEIRVSKSDFSPTEQSQGEFPSKRLKIAGFESPDLRLGSVQKKPGEQLLKSSKILESRSLRDLSGTVTDKNRDSSEKLELGNQQNYVSRCEVGEDIHTSAEELLNSSAISKSKSASPALRVHSGNVRNEIEDSFETLEPQIQQNHLPCSKVGECSHTKRRFEFQTNVINPEIERNMGSCLKGTSGVKEMNAEDIDKFRYTCANYPKLCGMERKAETKRILPSWTNAMVGAAALSKNTTKGTAAAKSPNARKGAAAPKSSNATLGAAALRHSATKGAAAAKSSNAKQEAIAAAATSSMKAKEGTAGNLPNSDVLSDKNSTKNSLANVLKALAKDDMQDENLKHLSLMEVVKRRGTAFTQPSWWPQEGFELKR